MHRSTSDSEEDGKSTVSVRCFTLKKWTLSLCILVEIVEAFIAIAISAVHYYNSSSGLHHQQQKEDSSLVALVLWLLVALVRLMFLYGVLSERFWLCLAYAVISFGHIVILATTGDHPNWLWVLFTTLLTIVGLLYVMDQFLIRQEKTEKKEQKLEEERKHVQQIQTVSNDNNNLNNGATDIKYIGTLV